MAYEQMGKQTNENKKCGRTSKSSLFTGQIQPKLQQNYNNAKSFFISANKDLFMLFMLP